MRNQYKVLQEAYECILREQEDNIAPDQPDTQPAQDSEQPWWWGDFLKDKRYSSHSSFQYNVPKIPGSNEMEAVDVPAETAYWIDNVLKMPRYRSARHSIIVGFLKVRDFSSPELKTILRAQGAGGPGIYLRYKNSKTEIIKNEIKPHGKIYNMLKNAKKAALYTSEEKDRLKKAAVLRSRIKRNKIEKSFRGNNIIKYIEGTAMAAYRRSYTASLPFFPNICLPKYTTWEELERRKKDFNKVAVTLYEIAWPKDNKCPALGIPLIPGRKTDNSPSLDKFIPERGYVEGNVQFISDLANRIKNSGTLKQMERLKDFALKSQENKQSILREIKNKINGFQPPGVILSTKKISSMMSGLKSRVRKQELKGKKIPIDVMFYQNYEDANGIIHNKGTDYLKSIFPLNMICPVLGIHLQFKEGEPGDNSPAVDKINPAEGYVPGNMIIVSNLANQMKNNATPEQILQVYDWMRIHNAVPDPQIREELKQKEQQDAQSI